jgi:acetyl-CoA synthetase
MCHALVQVCQAANYLKSVGIGKGDDVTCYMPMIPELPAIMVRGCVFVSVCFGGQREGEGRV